jgi:SAM-dependent methyltransferase
MSLTSLILRSPANDEHRLNIPPEVAHLRDPFSGDISSADGISFPIKRNIVELLGSDTPTITLAQSTNFLGLTAEAYEDYWRNRSISAISGQEFSIADEKSRLLEWLNPVAGKRYIDVGCSTALYARTLANAAPEATVIAIDMSLPMLRKAREKAIAEKTDLYLVQADAENMPFFSASVDGLAIGGSLNEFRDPAKALYESRRVLRKGGTAFLMYLLRAETFMGATLQRLSGVGGLSFWSPDESALLFERSGFAIRRQERLGIVDFVLLEAV